MNFDFARSLLCCICINMAACAAVAADPVTNMQWCLSGDDGGFETRDGKIIGVNVAQFKNTVDKQSLLELRDLKHLRLSTTAFESLGANGILSSFDDLESLKVRYMPQYNKRPLVSLNDYQLLLRVSRLRTLVLEDLDLTRDDAISDTAGNATIESLDVAIHLKSQLSPLLADLQLQELRLQLVGKSRDLNTNDLDVINHQRHLKSLALVGNRFQENAEIDFAKLSGLRQLQKLSLTNYTFNPELLTQFPSLEVLTIRRCLFNANSFDMLLHHPSLKKVVVVECSSDDLKLTAPLPPIETSVEKIELVMVPLEDLQLFAQGRFDLAVEFGNFLPLRYMERTGTEPRFWVRQMKSEELNLLLRCQNLREVRFSAFNNSTTTNDLLKMAHHPSLMSMAVTGTTLEDSAETKGRAESGETDLHRMTIITYPAPSPTLIQELLSPEIESVLLDATPKAGGSLYSWAEFEPPSIPRLQRLHLIDFNMSVDEKLWPRPLFTRSLKSVILENCWNTDLGLAEILRKSPAIESLRLEFCDFDNKIEPRAINKYDSLKSIDLFACDVSADDALALKAHRVRVGGKQMFLW